MVLRKISLMFFLGLGLVSSVAPAGDRAAVPLAAFGSGGAPNQSEAEIAHAAYLRNADVQEGELRAQLVLLQRALGTQPPSMLGRGDGLSATAFQQPPVRPVDFSAVGAQGGLSRANPQVTPAQMQELAGALGVPAANFHDGLATVKNLKIEKIQNYLILYPLVLPMIKEQLSDFGLTQKETHFVEELISAGVEAAKDCLPRMGNRDGKLDLDKLAQSDKMHIEMMNFYDIYNKKLTGRIPQAARDRIISTLRTVQLNTGSPADVVANPQAALKKSIETILTAVDDEISPESKQKIMQKTSEALQTAFPQPTTSKIPTWRSTPVMGATVGIALVAYFAVLNDRWSQEVRNGKTKLSRGAYLGKELLSLKLSDWTTYIKLLTLGTAGVVVYNQFSS